MNYYEKYFKYKQKYLLLKNKLSHNLQLQLGGDDCTIVDPNDEALKEQKTFPYNNIDFCEEYGDSFPEKKCFYG